MKAFVRVLQDLVLLVARLVLGGVSLLHGWYRWQTVGVEGQTQQFATAGVPAPEVFAWGVTMVELIGGALLVFGLLTPLLGLVFAAQAVLSVVWVTGPNGPWVADGGFEYVAVMGALALVLAGFGAGRASIDALFRRPPAEDESDELRYDDTRQG
ncbi:DoxX family protein [Desertihabitans brevis]|uniref:DoxX family protein n=1 Tax=Desertihabitans brevis TaxID=2268447 RepID=A0A367YW81_9ACTN|nr:DoxX family protein [Desertihabitans brevis]RCK70078.1 DoxX family protein [Desertihabitans brevis]